MALVLLTHGLCVELGRNLIGDALVRRVPSNHRGCSQRAETPAAWAHPRVTAATTHPRTTKEALGRASFVVEPVSDYSNKSHLIPPRLLELQKLANATRATEHLHEEHEHSTHRVRRRLEPGIIQDIARNYEAGATTPALCAEFGLSKTSVLRLL